MKVEGDKKKHCILFVTHEKEINGSTKSLLDLIEGLKNECRIIVLAPHSDGNAVKAFRDRNIVTIYAPYWNWRIKYHKNTFMYIRIKHMIYILRNILNIFSAYYIAALCKKYEVDIIHSNTSVTNLGALIARIMNIKHVWHLREFGEEDFEMKFILPSKVCYKFMYKSTDKFIYISNAIQNKYNLYFKNKGILIYDCINDSYIHRKSYSTSEVLKLLLAGHICESKGQMIACKAINEMVSSGMSNVKLYLAGKGEDASIREYIDTNKLEKNIILCGQIEQINIYREFTDVELVCSRCEAFGRVTIEAMMSGNPVIGSDVGGTSELIRNGFNGFLYCRDDVQDLVKKISFFYQYKNMIKIFGNNAYESVYKRYSCKAYVEKLIDIYRSI